MTDTGSGTPADPTAPGPLDLAYLEAQTGGDAGLLAEVLALFADGAEALLARLHGPEGRTEAGRRALAHRLDGSARAAGATALAREAGRVADGQAGTDAEPVPVSLAGALAQAVAAARAEFTRRGG